MNPLSAGPALDAYYLEARSKILDVAAILDRIERGDNLPALAADPRLARLREALTHLLEAHERRAEGVQQIFSLPYDAGWERPQPRG